MSTLAVEQPNYLPNFEFFCKMKNSDVFILADNFEYSSHSLINRTHIKTATGPRWLTVPVITRGRKHQRINEVLIDCSQNWAQNHWRSLQVNYCMAPYFDRHATFLEDAYGSSWEKLFHLNLRLVQQLSEQVLFKGRIVLSSQLPTVKNRTRRVITWLKANGCDEYLVSSQQLPLIDVDVINNRGYKVKCYDVNRPVYHQQFKDFSDDLSLIDMLFNEGPASIELLESCSIHYV